MQRQLKELQNLQDTINGFDLFESVDKKPPILIAGDIFDKWNPPPELINFAIKHLPKCYAIPGQHDLPNHNYEQIERTAYWTLVQAGIITDVHPDFPCEHNGLLIHGFPWGYPDMVQPPSNITPLMIDIALVHAYIWTKKACYEGAPDTHRLKAYKKKLKGYDYAIFGDNHKTFAWGEWEPPYPMLINPGGFFRRNIDQIDHKPLAYLIYANGDVIPHYFDVTEDKFLDMRELDKVKINGLSMEKFLRNLRDLKGVAISYEEAILRYLDKHKVSKFVRDVIVSVLEEEKA